MKKIKHKVFEIIEGDLKENFAHKVFEIIIATLIILNVFAIILEPLFLRHNSIIDKFRNFEIFSVIVFTTEYLLRIWTSNIKYNNEGFVKAKLKYIFSTLGIIDFLSIFPFYIAVFLPISIDGRIFRAFRLFRLLRILKMSRFLDSFKIIKKVVATRKHELLMTLFIAFLVLVVSSTIMFEVEHDAQPDKFPDVISTFWWAIATLTTIGYGDIYPITGLGKLLGSLISIMGIGLIALPAGILSSSFIEEFRNTKNKDEQKPNYCPHCGKKLNDK